MRRLIGPLILTMGSAVVALLLAELMVRGYQGLRGHSEEYEWEAAERWRGIHRLSADRELLYELTPGATARVDYGARNAVTYRVSLWGTRGTTPMIPKPAGILRVLILGDSVTFGYYVPEDSTFAAVTERCLNRHGLSFDVVNGGVGGYNTHNELAWLKVHGLAMDPDVVVLAFCPNDVDNPHFHFAWHTLDRLGSLPPEVFPDPAMMSVEPPRPAGFGAWLQKHSRLGALVCSRVSFLHQARVLRSVHDECDSTGGGVSRMPFGDCLLSLCDEGSPPWDWLKRHVEELDSLARAHGFNWIFLYLPLSYERADGVGTTVRMSLGEFAREHGGVFLDPFLQRRPPPGSLYLDATHLSPAGHRWISDALCPSLESQRLDTGHT